MDGLLLRHFDVDGAALPPAALETALDMMRDWLAAGRANPYPTAPFSQLKRDFADLPLPDEGMEIEVLLAGLRREVFANTAQLNHPKYIGHMTQALPWIAVLAEAFIATLNQNQVKIETAYVSTLIENKVLGWLHQRVYGRSDAFYAEVFADGDTPLGNMVGGGTMGNLTALAVALERQLPGARKAGLYAALQQAQCSGVAVLGSARTHYSLKKALATLGLGEDALQLIPVDAENRIDLAALERRIAELKERGVKILALVGLAGSTETGSIDPLAELAAIARREQLWFHVDAAWGGALLLADRYKALYRGIEQADSVVIDGHKLFWVTMAQSMVLFKDSASLDALKHNANYIIRARSGDLGQTSLEGSRRFDALKLWMSFKLLGMRGYATLLGQAGVLTEQMRVLIVADGDFELISASPTFILTYRYAPAGVQATLRELLAAGRLEEAAAANLRLNDLNAALQTRQKEAGQSFVSRTVLESTPYEGEIVVLRIILTNVKTTPRHLREILDEQRQLAAELSPPCG
ncbi:pyridoxal-dependent decarboxylase [Janthinobacterium sp.]|uniref:pyridoxal-dependent decarboxylase n=1 Tax=Janthinobacterium sp. TaxID=1871054 RepID=UPI00293D3D86|nr:pyridoxal-dependent decarboxylase [Janthinobacterium sp.]